MHTFDFVKHASKRSTSSPVYSRRGLVCTIHALDHGLAMHVVMDPTARSPTENLTWTLPVLWKNVSGVASNRAAFAPFQELYSIIGSPLLMALFVDQVIYAKGHCARNLRKMLKLITIRFKDILNFQSYRLINHDQNYEDYVVAKHKIENCQAQAGANTP